jgi:transcriptional accessory protein Tex/SPT6
MAADLGCTVSDLMRDGKLRAFVDIGVHQDGLVHVSQLSDSFIKDASEVMKPGQSPRDRD